MSSRQFIGPFSKSTYRQRRQALAKQIAREDKDAVLIFWSGSEIIRSNDGHFPFRAHSNFLYLTGFEEPESALVIVIQAGKSKSILALRPRDLGPQRGSEIWEGERMGVERAVTMAGVDEAWDIHQLHDRLRDVLMKTSCVYWKFGEFCGIDSKLTQLAREIENHRKSSSGIRAWKDSHLAVAEMRKKKTAEELKIMKISADIASKAHIRAMTCIRPGQFEFEVQSETEREFLKNGAMAPAYNSIVATGNNACTLHYHYNDQKIGKNDLLLMDAGCEYRSYASDITRCFPASGRFTEAQKEVYGWVLKAQKAAIRSVKPGVSWRKPHEVATKVLSEALSKMGIIKKSPTEIYKKSLWSRYMPHGTSHWLGIDVHDCGSYYDDKEKPLPLEVGNVLTIEPGLYFASHDRSVSKKYRGIGVRIEDDVAVTRSGHWVLTENCPKEIEEIEALRIPRM